MPSLRLPFPSPRLQHLALTPLRWLPARFHAGALALALNKVLTDALHSGELEFLHDRSLCLRIDDLELEYPIRLSAGRFHALPNGAHAEVRFSGNLETFLLLATGREDADSLFFQRRLRIEGDTALGLHLKNFIDALGQPPLPAVLRSALERIVDLYPKHG